MRKIDVFKYERKAGNNFHDKIPDGTAVFHRWGLDYEEFESGGCAYSSAIIEREDGTVQNVPAEMIRFQQTK